MIYNERIEYILHQVQLRAIVKISDLSEELQVSVDTVRRDLKNMEQSGLIKCIRGGACLPDSLASLSGFAGREIIHSDLKREVARKAMHYIKPGATIALNSGTTNTILAQELLLRNEDITVITNNIAAINILMQSPSIHLIAIGGIIDSSEKSTYGSVCEKEFGAYYADIAFLSINAVNEQDGFTDFRMSEIGIIQLLAERAERVIAVMDSSKLGQRSKKRVLSLDQVDRVLMDDCVPDKLIEEYRARGLNIE
ncbi:MAG: DeoR/GlpR transcriptional regulator [Lachnospiraceae bacterium]|nr:DeoR/GlpR transcriptional regulator [Lachnospiraceae bacterium]